MRALLALLALLSVLLAPTAANADDAPTAPAMTEDAASEPQAPIAPLEAGTPAPFDGYLVAEARFMAYLGLQVQLMEARMTLDNVRRGAEQMITGLNEQLLTAQEAHQPGWFERNGLIVGMVLGVVCTGLLVWGAVRVLDVQNE